MLTLSNQELLEVYMKAKHFRLSQDFIQLILSEFDRRNLPLPDGSGKSELDGGRHHAV